MEFKNMNERASYNAAYHIAQGAHLMGAQINPETAAKAYVCYYRDWGKSMSRGDVVALMGPEEFIYDLLMQPV